MTSAAASLKEYLKRYESRDDNSKNESGKKKKKKKGSKPTSAARNGILIVDEDPTWQKPINLQEEEPNHSDSAGEDNPVVEEDIEVKRLRRLEMIRAKKPYLSVSEDGSGWVSVSDHKAAFPNSSPRRGRNDTPSPGREPDRIEGDMSPPRKKRRGSPEEPLHARGARRDSPDMDISPPRRRHSRADSPEVDLSPCRRDRKGPRESPKESLRPRGARLDSPDMDISPPRRRHSRVDSPEVDLLPPRRGQRGSRESPEEFLRPRGARRGSPDVDISPPRRRHSRMDSPKMDLSPPRRGRKGSRESNLSPPRRRMSSSGLDLSPRRRGAQKKSPPRCDRRYSADLDISPPRRGRGDSSDVDVSAPHRAGEGSTKEDLSPPRKTRRTLVENERMTKFADAQRVEHAPQREGGGKEAPDEGKRKGGLYTGTQIREEIDRKKAEDLSRFEALDAVKSGKGAEPVYRSQGKRISKEEKLKLEKGEEKPKEKKLEWGKGLAQKRDAEAKALEVELEKERPFARSRDDPELDKMMKDRIRWGDPMAHLVKKKDPNFHMRDFGDDEKMKESGFIVPQEIPSHSWLKRGIDPPPNRYGIKPGRHWDGVDRSTGYEKELFKRQNDKAATQTEAYLWSVADM